MAKEINSGSKSIQLHATLRNEYVEIFVDFAIRKALEMLKEKGVIKEVVLPERHKIFKAIDASDVFDHFFKIKFSSGGEVEYWGQTTCYKGNDLGIPEANKTYEIRETLIEALTLRRHLLAEDKKFRTFHFTFGPSDYTYGWFAGAKENTFDWSFYSTDLASNQDIFIHLFNELGIINSEYEAYVLLEKIILDKTSLLNPFLNLFIIEISTWLQKNSNQNKIADQQAEILNSEYNLIESKISKTIKSSKEGGSNIKGRVVSAISSGDTSDSVISATLKRIYAANNFISRAIQALADWDSWSNAVLKETHVQKLRQLIDYLWNIEDDFYITRRLLVRLFSKNNVFYPADLNIRGITEHTLYTTRHNASLTSQVISYLENKYSEVKIDTNELKKLIKSPQAKNIIISALKHDTTNGTTLKPSFYYVEEALKGFFEFKSFEEAGLPLPVGYHASFDASKVVQSYGNLKVVVDKKSQKAIAIIKAKYYRKQEFPRRAKEEAYVGLTTKYQFKNGKFLHRYKIPLIMFIDMDSTLIPPEFAVVRLMTTGWLPFFNIEKLKVFLQGLI